MHISLAFSAIKNHYYSNYFNHFFDNFRSIYTLRCVSTRKLSILYLHMPVMIKNINFSIDIRSEWATQTWAVVTSRGLKTIYNLMWWKHDPPLPALSSASTSNTFQPLSFPCYYNTFKSSSLLPCVSASS